MSVSFCVFSYFFFKILMYRSMAIPDLTAFDLFYECSWQYNNLFLASSKDFILLNLRMQNNLILAKLMVSIYYRFHILV